MSDFRQDIIDLFEHRRGGHVQHWLYNTEEGSRLWRAFYSANKSYYIPGDETRLIQTKVQDMIAHSDVDTVADFGVGDRDAVLNKAMPVISGLKNAQIYCGIDISQEFLDQARQVVNDNAPQIEVVTRHNDFHNGPIDMPGKNRLGLLFGGSVTNQQMIVGRGLPHNAIAQNLSDFRRHLGEGSEMLITYDSNPDAKRAMGAYKSPHWSQHIVGLMHMVAGKLQTGGDFSPDEWYHEMVWDPKVHVIHQCLVANKRQTLVMGDREFNFNKGERFVAVNNFKFTREDFEALCEEAGFTLRTVESYKTIRLQHLEV